MNPNTSSNKVYTVLILCIGIVISIWLFQKTIEKSDSLEQNAKSQEVSVIRNIEENVNDDWKKILVNVDPKDQIATNLTKTDNSIFEETTLTAQISKDFLSQYLLLKQGGKELNSNEINQIVNNILESKNYTEVKRPIYISSNLNITSKNDRATEKKYEDNVNLIIKTRSSQIKEDPILLINQTMGPKKIASLAKIDFIIKVGKSFIEDLLKIEVPIKAVTVHLEVLNTVSRLVADVEAMREIDSDPIRSLAGISQYNADLISFQNAIKKINLYFVQN